MNNKEEILRLFYDENIKIVDIASKINVSRAYISKVIKKDDRYEEKKKSQKEESKKRKKEYTKLKMKQIREEKATQDAYIKQQHLQATMELSKGKATISNRAILKWNSSAYKYNSNKKRYEFDRKLNKSYALPKYIKFEN